MNERQDLLLANVHKEQPREVPNVRRQGRLESKMEIRGEYERVLTLMRMH